MYKKTKQTNTAKIDWSNFESITPNFIGRKVLDPIKIESIVPYINWRQFFKSWNYDEKFSTVKNISMCGHCKAQWFAAFNEGEREQAMEASKLYDTAFALLQRIIYINAEYIKTVFVIKEAYSQNDNIFINSIPFAMPHIKILTQGNVHFNLSNYIAPKSSNKKDYIAAFAVTGGAGTEYLLNKYRKEGDEHKALVLESLLQRLAEGAVEWLHEKIRKEYWGFAKNEELTIPAMLIGKYSGIRATVGSPLIPNKELNLKLNKLLQTEEIYLSIDNDGAITPSASITGFILSHPEAKKVIE